MGYIAQIKVSYGNFYVYYAFNGYINHAQNASDN